MRQYTPNFSVFANGETQSQMHIQDASIYNCGLSKKSRIKIECTAGTKIETSLSIAMTDTSNSNFFSNQISVIIKIKKQQFRVYQTPDDHKKTNKDQIHKCCLESSKSVFYMLADHIPI